MIQPDLIDLHAARLDAEHPGEAPLPADRDIAETDRLMPVIEQRPCDDPNRIREVDDPGVVRRTFSYAVGDPEHDRNGAQGLAETTGAGRLLPDAAAGKWHGLIREASLLAADADLDQDEVGAVDSSVEVVGDLEPPFVPLPVEHALREPTDNFAPLRIDVLQHELADVDPLALARQPRHELGRVRRAAADDRDLHPFTPVSVTPSTNAFCARKKTMITGAITSSVAAMVRFHCTWCRERNSESPIWSTQLLGFSRV